MEGDSCIRLGPRIETGDFTSEIQGLDQNTTYYIRAYAVNGAGSAYGKGMVVTTDPDLDCSACGNFRCAYGHRVLRHSRWGDP